MIERQMDGWMNVCCEQHKRRILLCNILFLSLKPHFSKFCMFFPLLFFQFKVPCQLVRHTFYIHLQKTLYTYKNIFIKYIRMVCNKYFMLKCLPRTMEPFGETIVKYSFRVLLKKKTWKKPYIGEYILMLLSLL